MRLPTRLLRRKPDTCKNDFGHVFILGGSERYSGAAVLCGSAAMRSGAGLVTLGLPKGLNRQITRIKSKEVMTLGLPQTRGGSLSLSAFKQISRFIEKIDILVVGPGLGLERSTQELVRKLVKTVRKPIVIDADGINALAGHPDFLRRTQNAERTTILTPHPGEMARLLGVSTGEVQGQRLRLAKKFSREWAVVLVLKGNRTVVCGHQGKSYLNKTGNPGMATAGSGDVLTGMIAAFLGQGLDGFSAAKYAVYLHGLAGDLAAKEKTQAGMIASDIIENIPAAFKSRTASCVRR